MDDLTADPPIRLGRAALPPPAPLEMPDQALARRPDPPASLGSDPGSRLMRLVLFCGSATVTALLGHEMYMVLSGGETGWIAYLMVALFLVNIGWISLGTCSTVLGLLFAPGSARPSRQPDAQPDAQGAAISTALLVPIYNEDTASVVGAARATLRQLDLAGCADPFNVFLLSDTTRPDVWLTERRLVDAARAEPLMAAKLFYRHRLRNRERKAGNIRDWVERWGGAYEAFIVLDADSLMEADAIVELARRMAADPRAGLIQTAPRLIGARTPLARVQQFATRVYGPVQAAGLAAWFGNAGSYWGHNAIVRTRAFAAAAGLPTLSGGPPFGGLILSHDFVEAALLRRAGWAVRLAPDIQGSYERGPPNLVELVARDRRWCQGNLQHLRLLGTAGMHPLGRLHLAMGAMSYIASPLWMMFLLAGMALALYSSLVPPEYFTDEWSLFPKWPQFDAQRAIMLFGACMAVLFAPKLLGLAVFLAEPAARGHRWRAMIGFVVETVLSALLAPVLMLTQTRAIFQIVTGRDSGWNIQSRDAASVPWRVLLRVHRSHVLVGLVLALAAGAISASLLAWMTPAIAGLVLSVPLAALLASRRAGDFLARHGILVTPEDTAEPAIARAAAAASVEAEAETTARPSSVLADPRALADHISALDTATARRPGEPDATFANALLRLSDGTGLAELDDREVHALLSEPEFLRRVARGDVPGWSAFRAHRTAEMRAAAER